MSLRLGEAMVIVGRVNAMAMSCRKSIVTVRGKEICMGGTMRHVLDFRVNPENLKFVKKDGDGNENGN